MNNCRMFWGLSEEEVTLAKEQWNYTTSKYKKGQTIIEENSIVKEIGIIIRGNLCVSKFTEDGREILMQKLLPSYIIGAEIALTRKQDSPYSVYASEDSEIAWFSVGKIMKKGSLNEDIKMKILKNLMYFIADENIRKYYKIEAISTKGVRRKIVRYLSIQQKKRASNKIYLKFNRKEKFHCTIILITHDFNESIRLSDRVAILLDGEIRDVVDSDKLFRYNKDKEVNKFLGIGDRLDRKRII